MKTLAKSAIAALSAVFLSLSAHALTIVPGDAILFGPETGQAAIDTAIASTLLGADELYKNNVSGTATGSESGTFASSYQTTYGAPVNDPDSATIIYTGGAIIGPTAYLLVKDGNNNPAWYLFNLTTLGWTGTQALELTGFWPNQGAISHVALYGGGTPEEYPGVPDSGSTVALLGLAFAALAYAKRKF